MLDRVVRHNPRNDLGVVDGMVEALAEDLEGDAAARAGHIREKFDDIVELAAKARDVERVISVETSQATAVDLGEFVETVRADVSAADPDAEVTVEIPTGLSVVTARSALALALENLLENAVEHNDGATPRVWIRAAETTSGVRIVDEDRTADRAAPCVE